MNNNSNNIDCNGRYCAVSRNPRDVQLSRITFSETYIICIYT